MKKKSLETLSSFALLVPAAWCVAAGQESVREKAAAAIRAGDYEAAIRLCHDGLKKTTWT